MTDETTHLAEVLDRATDLIAPTGRGAQAAIEARRRRTQRRMVGVASVAVLTCVVGVLALTRPAGEERPQPTAPTTRTTTTDAPATPSVVAWNPFTVVDAPLRPSVLPQQIQPPDDAPSVLDRPLSAAALVWPAKGRDLRLLGTDGTWRIVPGTADAVAGTLDGVVHPALNFDGTRVAMAVTAGLRVIDVTTGEDRVVPWPDPIAEPWDSAPGLRWLPGDEEIAVLHWKDTWVMELDGSIRKPPWGRAYGGGLGFDVDGYTIEQAQAYGGFDVWSGDQLVRRLPSTYWTTSVVAGHGRIAFVGSGTLLPEGTTGPVLLDAATGDLVAAAPVPDPDSAYGDNGHLRALGFLDAATVAYLVGPMDFRTMDPGDETWHLVAWDADSGAFERLTSWSSTTSGAVFALGPLASP